MYGFTLFLGRKNVNANSVLEIFGGLRKYGTRKKEEMKISLREEKKEQIR